MFNKELTYKHSDDFQVFQIFVNFTLYALSIQNYALLEVLYGTTCSVGTKS